MDSRTLATPFLSGMLCAFCSWAGAGSSAPDSSTQDAFSFSSQAAKEQAQNQADAASRAQGIQALVSVPCRERLKNQKILLLIGEHTAAQWMTDQQRYAQLFQVIETRLQALGLKTYTQEQIKASIAQAEVDAYFNNDPDAALSASKRLGASYILRGSISSQAGVNPVVQVNEVAVNIELTLSGVDGHILSDVSARSDSYSGTDTLHTALVLVKEQADPLIARLYNDYCREGAGH